MCYLHEVVGRSIFNLVVLWSFASSAVAQEARPLPREMILRATRQRHFNLTKPIQTERILEFAQQADAFLETVPLIKPPSAECASMQLLVQPVAKPYFKRIDMHPHYTRCDWVVGSWVVIQSETDREAYKVFFERIRAWWWANEMPAISAKYGSHPVDLAVWFEDTMRLMWTAALAVRNERELRKIAGTYMQDVLAGRVLPEWLADGKINARSHIVK